MSDMLRADTADIGHTGMTIGDAADEASALASQVLATAESTDWRGSASDAFRDAVETFRSKKDQLDAMLREMGGNVNLAGTEIEMTEDDRTRGMEAKGAAIG